MDEATSTAPDSSKASAVTDKPQTPVHENAGAKAAYGDGPLGPSWATWFSPDAVYAGGKPATKGGSMDADWNILYHLGGDGPWVQKTQDVVEGETVSPPEGCAVEQVHMLSRHGERFPTGGKGEEIQKIVDKMQGGQPKGALAFLREWQHFVTGMNHTTTYVRC
jgi:acid phosphatase